MYRTCMWPVLVPRDRDRIVCRGIPVIAQWVYSFASGSLPSREFVFARVCDGHVTSQHSKWYHPTVVKEGVC